MNRIASIRRSALRLAALLLLAEVGLVFAQSPALPATPPTAAQPPAVAATPTVAATHRAQVVYSEGQLSITADNSSLNQILRDISRQTGMKITGGVVEQRVFGKYGPGSSSQILASLIEGTGSNMLLRYGPSHVPAELVLTPRMGGPTPPSPSAPEYNDASDEQPRSSMQPPPPGQQPQSTVQPPTSQGISASSYFFGTPEADTPSTTSTPNAAPSTNQPSNTTTPTSNATYPQSPNGIKTPQQITQGLQQLPQ
jgi:hypothetical protein